MSTQELLFELGCEELPAGPLSGMAMSLHDTLCAGLRSSGLTFASSQQFATPRRLAVRVSALSSKAPDVQREILGPPAAAAKDAQGNWTPAAIGFARKQGLSTEELSIIETTKGARIGLRRLERGAVCADILPDLITEAVRTIPVAKRMRWGRGRDEFLRPVQWLVLMLDASVVPMALFGLASGNQSSGHRFHHPMNLTLEHAADYESALEEAYVKASFSARKSSIEHQVRNLGSVSRQPVIDAALLDEVTGLVEWPVAVKGTFDEAFLEVPPEALISSMKEHQKYFHVVDDSGNLVPEFIAIANIESTNPSSVIAGNERVIRPRLSDAAFFFRTDKKTTLASRGDRLSGVVFQNQLGTLADKRDRMMGLCSHIARSMGAVESVAVRAAELAKCDLVSEMVLEFPDLQGIAGAQYAKNDAEPAGVADAIEQHYWPRFAGDSLPHSREGDTVALADRLDSLVGIFGIGQTPTGSKDPFALRRASLAVLRILIERRSSLALSALLEVAVTQYPADVLDQQTVPKARAYIIDRLPAWYEEQGISIEILRAVTALGLDVPSDIDARVKALAMFAGSEAAIALAAANKRVANILTKTDANTLGDVDIALFESSVESELHDQLSGIESALDPLIAERRYSEALEALARLREPVDLFFDQVMVNAEDPSIRLNRLRLLSRLRDSFLRVADLAMISV